MTEWHPIRVVARRTGLSAHVIRAWEKRYGAVEPERTPTNRRVYSTEDVARLNLLRRATEAGRSIGQIARLPTDELKRLVEEDESAAASMRVTPRSSSRSPVEREGAPLLHAALEAARKLDTGALQRVLDEASVSLSRHALMERIIVPLMQQIGEEWRLGSLRVAHEHLASAVVRSYIGGMNGAFHQGPTAPEIVVTTPAGQLHEIGALLAAATAASEGWRATYLGPSLPAEEIAAAVRQNGARAVALSIVHPTDDPHVRQELQRLSQLLGSETAILVGGRAAGGYRTALEAFGALVLPDYQSFRVALESLRETGD